MATIGIGRGGGGGSVVTVTIDTVPVDGVSVVVASVACTWRKSGGRGWRRRGARRRGARQKQRAVMHVVVRTGIHMSRKAVGAERRLCRETGDGCAVFVRALGEPSRRPFGRSVVIDMAPVVHER